MKRDRSMFLEQWLILADESCCSRQAFLDY